MFTNPDIRKISSVLSEFFSRYKYIVIIAVLGLALLMWPSGKASEMEEAPISTEAVYDMEGKLRHILSKIEGVGRLEVSLTLKSGVEVQYADEVSQSSQQRVEKGELSESEVSEDSKVVVLRSKDGNEAAAVIKEIYPEALGAVVVCDGADNAGVRLRITEAVSALTGLGSNRISVVKME